MVITCEITSWRWVPFLCEKPPRYRVRATTRRGRSHSASGSSPFCAAHRGGSMFKRVVFSASAIAAMLAVLFVILPAGAIGSDRALSTVRSHDRYAFKSIVVSDRVDGDLHA